MGITKARMTEEEFMRLPDDGRKYELVDGEPKEVPTSVPHDIIGGNLFAILKPYAKGHGFMSMGQAGFRMTDGNIRCPDVSFTSKIHYRQIPTGFGSVAPDLCVEIISPTEEPADMERKVREYFASGAQLVWHIFPETLEIKVFMSPTEVKIYTAEEEIDCGELLPGFRCRVEELFELE